MSRRSIFAALALGAMVFSGAPRSAQAAASVQQATPRYSLSATRLVIGYGQMSAVLNVQNLDMQTERFEIRTYAWSQDGEMRKVETKDVPLVFPRVFSVDPAGQTPVRVGILDSTPGIEAAYRILVQNLPGAIPDNGGMFHFITSYEIPLFVEPKDPHPDARITGATGAYGQVTLHLNNDGNAHALIRDVDMTLQGKSQTQPLLGYVLAKSHGDLNVNYKGCGSGTLHIMPDTESRIPPADVRVDIPCSPPHVARK